MKYTFCEPAFVVTIRQWCIRPLTDAGKKFGGGIDTGPLCGKWRGNGWDIDVEMTEHHLDKSACHRCAELYRVAVDAPEGESP